MNRRNTRKNTGFSITEVLCHILFLLFLVGIASPSFSDYLKTNEIYSQREAFRNTVMHARQQAVYLARSVSICPLGNNETCGLDWSQGWLVFQDDGQGGEGIAADGKLNGNERVIKSWVFANENQVSVKNMEKQSWVHAISFSSLGRPIANGQEDKRNLLVAVCDSAQSLNLARGLLINEKGEVNKTRDYDGDGFHEFDSNDQNLLRCS